MFSDSNEADEKKIKKAIKLIEMKDRKLNKSKDSEMVDSIKSKLAVLKQMIRWLTILLWWNTSKNDILDQACHYKD